MSKIVSKTKQRKAGVILQYLQMALNIVISLIYTPVMLRILGKTEYGIYNLSSSIIAYLSLISLGFGASYIRFYSIYSKDDDKESIKRMNGLYLIVFISMGVVSLILGTILTNNVNIFYNDTYSSHDIEIARILMLFLTVNMAISFPASVFTSYISAQEQFIFQKIINMGKTIISPVACIVLLYLGYGSVGMVICTTTVSIVIDVINITYCMKYLGMQISFRNPNLYLLKDIFIFSVFIALNQVIDQINWQTDKVILGKLINGSSVAVYSVGAQINTMFTMFSTAISHVFSPKVNRIVSKGESDMDDQLTSLFIRVGRIQWFVLALILSGFVFFGRFFVYKWAGEGYDTAYWVAILLMAPAIIPLIQNIGLEIQRAKNKHQFRAIIYSFMAILNIFISIAFAKLWGEIGTALGTTISLLVANGLIMNIFYQKKLGINVVLFWKSILKTVKGLVIPILFGVMIMLFYRIDNMLEFLVLACIYALIYVVSSYYFGFVKEERELIQSMFKGLMRR